MGETRPKTELDQEYRGIVAQWLAGVWMKHKLKSQAQLAKALGVDRSTASRYLSQDTRAPLQRLMYLERSLGEKIPQEIVDAYWASDIPAPDQEFRDIEAELRRVAESLKDKTEKEKTEFITELRRVLARQG